ncbi:PEP-CTERM sorting domain-containing protein [Albimonas sp. CAU 1670]|uniref:PEP-CTERM sorting domain-containing protein n=1 Tax=Albimonas sp. CAU 1670 TaxID=3032599 RepID=UPI0023DC0BE6|nr:PEP-CTERM sorting domain-containing protein [Albimonas sp. CAU 1670]MDF2232601.1 PEP-CTERM sorting domain-containing protein [Albimonas sp. CAU 1670]
MNIATSIAAAAALTAGLLAAAGEAHALVHAEIGDAGDSFGTAQAVDATTLTGISGTLTEADNDLYSFVLAAPKYVSVLNLSPDLTLDATFDAFDIGFGDDSESLAYCNDCFFVGSGPGSVAFLNVLVGPGTYFLGVVDTDLQPPPGDPPLNPLGAYSFDVVLSDGPVAVPLPGAAGLALMGLGALGLVARRRRA